MASISLAPSVVPTRGLLTVMMERTIRPSISFTRIFDIEGSSLNIHSTSIPRKTVPSYLCVPQDFPNCPPSSQNTDSLSTQRQLGLRTANTSLLSWRWIKPITTKSLAGRRPASIIYPHKWCSLRGCSDTHVSQCQVNCSGQRSVWAFLLQRPGKQL